MNQRVAGWVLIGLALLLFSIHLPILKSAAYLGNVAPGWPMGYIAIATVVVPFAVGTYLVLRKR